MDYKRIEIKSLGIGLLDISNLDLTNNNNQIQTYLAVGQKEPNTNSLDIKHNLIVSENAIGINTTRSNVNIDNVNSLIVNGNIKCRGSIIADNIILDSPNLDFLNSNRENFNQILNRISSHLLFYNVKDYLENNIYTNFNVVIGNEDYANNNTNSFKISRYANNNFSNIQFAIENTDITDNNQMTKFSMGIIGNYSNSPTHIITSTGMPFHFNISKTANEMNSIYNDRSIPTYSTNNYPSLAIDTNNSVLVNLDKLDNNINYIKFERNNQSLTINTTISTKPSLYVNGVLYANTIIINDYITNEPANLDSLYVRKGSAGGLSISANQIYGGEFNKIEIKFNSNVNIGDNNNNFNLNVYGNIQNTNEINTTSLNTNNLRVRNNLIVDGLGTTQFKNDCHFTGTNYFSNINIKTGTINTLTITDNIIYQGVLLSITPNTTIITNPPLIINQIIDNSIILGGQTSGITDPTYGSEILNIYKYKAGQLGKFEIYLNNYGSKSYIGHNELPMLNNLKDDSLIIFTENDINWNNIYFYSGKRKDDLNSLIPNLAIMENNKIGINTNKPEKTLDINGDIISSNYFIRKDNNQIYKCSLPLNYNNSSSNFINLNNLNINFNELDIDFNNTNLKKLNVKGGINSFNGYYENNKELITIKKIDNENSIIDNNLGINIALTNSQITIPLQIRNNNTNNNKINNSVLTFYKSKDNSSYSGIEFCDDATNTSTVHNNKWYIYKNHITDDISFVGPLKIGYMNNSYKPLKSCMNIYYSKNDKYYIDINSPYNYKTDIDYENKKETVRINGSVKINGDLDIDGSVNITGNYKFNDNNILFSPNPVQSIINKIYSLGDNVYYFDTVLSPNHPKKISFNNKITSSDIYSNIIFDTNSATSGIDTINTSNNLRVSYSNYQIVQSSPSLINQQLLLNNFILASNVSNAVINSYPQKNNQITRNSINNYLLASNLYNNPSTTFNNYLSIASNNYNYDINTSNRVSFSSSSYSSIASNLNSNIKNLSLFNSNIKTEIQNYNNDITFIYQNSNVYDKYSTILDDLTFINNDLNNTNIYLYNDDHNDIKTNQELFPLSNSIYTNTSDLNLSSSNLNNIAKDIYINLSNINNIINNYYLTSFTYSNNAYSSNQLSLNSNLNIINNYSSLSNVIDVKNIINCANSNQSISTNIYNITSNFNNSLGNFKTLIQNCSNLSYNDYKITSNNSNINSYYNSFINNSNQLSNLLLNNKNNAYNNFITTSNIYNHLLDSYKSFYYDDNYNEILSNKSMIISNTNDNEINKNINSTSRIMSSINTNLNTYLSTSSNNYVLSSNIDNLVSSFNLDTGETLSYYKNKSDIGVGIGKVITFINNEINFFNTYYSNLKLLEINYSFINNYNNYQKSLIQNNFCIDLLKDIQTDINNINTNNSGIDDTNSHDLSILLELVLHITNKYINFINKSYDFAALVSNLAQEMNDDISIFTTTALTEIPLLLLVINYSNTILNECWEIISKGIVNYASLSYSINSLIGSMPSLTSSITNPEGQNTDVLIIGNNIKYYPNNSIYIGHVNDYSRWLDNSLANDNGITSNYKSLLYLYNYNSDSVVCSFNSRSLKFISTPGITSLKTSSAIDINLIDSTQKSYEQSLIDSVSLKLSHIYKRPDLNTIVPSENKSLVELVRRGNDEKPYFSCYTTNDNNNIINIGSRTNFYNPITYDCIDENVVMHINEATSKYSFKITNNSENPLLVGFRNNQINKWDFKIDNDFGFNFSNLNILNITPNGLSINSTDTNNSSLFVNSYDNSSCALKIKNNYLNPYSITSNKDINVYNSFDVNYTNEGIIYNKKGNFLTDYEPILKNFIINKNINITSNIIGTLSNVKFNYDNINSLSLYTNFKFYSNVNNSSNVIDLMPIINTTDTNLIITNNNYKYYLYNFSYRGVGFNIYYKTPNDVAEFISSIEEDNDGNDYTFKIKTTIKYPNIEYPSTNYTTTTINNIIINNGNTNYYITNIVEYYKYYTFTIPTLDVRLSNYSYDLFRTNNKVPLNLYNDISNPNNLITTTSNLNNGNQICLSNVFNYLKSSTNITSTVNRTFQEEKLINYPITILNKIYYLPIYISIIDTYPIITNNNNNLEIGFINNSIKKPSITQLNIYNNSHKIYSYTDNYEIYFNDDKLLNIDPKGTLTTYGNILTNDIYLKGNIYSPDGKSLFDNVISILNNTNTNLEFKTEKNIILNPSKDNNVIRNKKYGVYINATETNSEYNNLFQINNFSDNDNLLTLNSKTQNSFIHFITNSQKQQTANSTNCIYRFGTLDDNFGIWRKNNIPSKYDPNYFIDTAISDSISNYDEILKLSKNLTNQNQYVLYISGLTATLSDRRLKKDIKRIDNALDKICKLEGITYKFLNDNNDNNNENNNTGLIAQDVLEVLPQAVVEDDKGFYSIAYPNMLGLVVEAIKELRQELNELKKNKI